jgi:hypothetical protein
MTYDGKDVAGTGHREWIKRPLCPDSTQFQPMLDLVLDNITVLLQFIRSRLQSKLQQLVAVRLLAYNLTTSTIVLHPRISKPPRMDPSSD